MAWKQALIPRRIPRFPAVLLALPAAALGGCIEYTVETNLLEDGGGSREIRMEVRDAEDNTDFGLDLLDFRTLTFVTGADGWTHETRVASGDTTHLFRRARTVPDLSSWSRLSGDVRISGALPSQASTEVGYLTLGEVQFRNRILVGSTRKSDGSASFSYTETFAWENGVDIILELMVREMEAALLERYPSLPDRARGEIVGIARARFREAVEDGVFEDDSQWDEYWDRAFHRIAAQSIQVLSASHAGATEESLRRTIDLFTGDAGDELDRTFNLTLPGLALSFSSEITFNLTMPGEVKSSNAHRQDGNTLQWEFSPGDALTAPVVLVAESAVKGALLPEAPGR